MKKLICAVLTLMLALSVFSALAASDLTDFFCAEEEFSTKIPADSTAQYETGTGLQIYAGKPGYVPFVIVSRRPDDMKFKNPVDFLNNVYREYMEDKYGSNMVGTNPAKDWEIGGKTLLGARYKYKVNGTTLCLLRLIEIRDDGDVEYSAKFIDGDDAATMDVLDAAVRYYTTGMTSVGPDDLILVDPFDSVPTVQSDAQILEPEDLSGGEVNSTDGIYWVKITDADKIMSGGYFTAKLYLQDIYPASRIEALKSGDQVQVNGKVYTVKSVQPHDDGTLELIPAEEFDGYIVFKKESGPFYTALVNDWVPCTHIADQKVMMPLPNNFTFGWIGGDDSAEIYDADAFIKLIYNNDAENLSQYNTMLQYENGLVMLIMHTDYPFGPEME